MKMQKSMKGWMVAAAVAIATSSAFADPITVNWAASGKALELNNGAPLPIGDLVQIGYFTGASNNLANFTAWASGAIGDSFPFAGVFSDATIGDDTASGGVAHKQIYIVAWDAPTAGAATQVGVFTAFIAGPPPPWQFPAGTDVPNATSIDLGDAGVFAVRGSEGVPFEVTTGVNLPAFKLDLINPIPEPSTIVLVGMGLLGAVTLRRRRS